MKDFLPFYLYTNLRSLKRYLVNYKIQPSAFDGTARYTLSDFGQDFLIFWRREVAVETIRHYCKADANDIPVVLQVYLPPHLKVEAFSETTDTKQCVLSKCAASAAVKVSDPIPFLNVIKILSVDQPLTFLQGDTTQNIPYVLLGDTPYTAPDDAIGEATVAAVQAICNPAIALPDDDAEDDEGTTLFGTQDGFDSPQGENAVRRRSLKQDKIIASYAMFIQGKKPFNSTMTHRLYAALSPDKRSFSDYIQEVFYPLVDRQTVSDCVRSSAVDGRYIETFNRLVYGNGSADDLLGEAISVLLCHTYTADDRAMFRDDFLAAIEDDETRAKVAECLTDPRVRNRMQELRDDLPDLIPLYFLYAFFDYGLDRFCENIVEYKLDAAGYDNVVLALWALLHGINDIYGEYKPVSLLYALMRKDNSSMCIDYTTFSKLNHIKHRSKIDREFQGVYCSYENAKIEYRFCVGDAEQNIRKLLCDLGSELEQVFDFRYAAIRRALQVSLSEVTREEIQANRKTIHDRYLQLTQKQMPKKAKSKKKSSNQPSFFDGMGDNE